MDNINITPELAKEVVFFVLSTQTTQDAQEEFRSFLEDVSPSLRAVVLAEIFEQSMRKNEIMKLIVASESHT